METMPPKERAEFELALHYLQNLRGLLQEKTPGAVLAAISALSRGLQMKEQK